MMKLFSRLVLLAFFAGTLCASARSQSLIYGPTEFGSDNTVIPTTTAGDTLFVAIDSGPTTFVTSATIGSQALTEISCSPVGGAIGGKMCLWWVPSLTGGQTALLTGAVTPEFAYYYEFSGTSGFTAYTAGTCTGTTTCAASFTPPNSGSTLLVTAFSCNGTATSMSGTNATFANESFAGGDATGTAVVTSTAVATATVNSTCGAGGASTAVGALWGFNGGGGPSVGTVDKRSKLKKLGIL